MQGKAQVAYRRAARRRWLPLGWESTTGWGSPSRRGWAVLARSRTRRARRRWRRLPAVWGPCAVATWRRRVGMWDGLGALPCGLSLARRTDAASVPHVALEDGPLRDGRLSMPGSCAGSCYSALSSPVNMRGRGGARCDDGGGAEALPANPPIHRRMWI